MQLAAPRILDFTDPVSLKVLFSAPMPNLAQIEACIRLDLSTPVEGQKEPAIARHRRYIMQLLALVTPQAPLSPLQWIKWKLEQRRRAKWLRSLQYHQLLDLYRKLMLTVQGFDFDTLEEFERAVLAQKKSTVTEPLNQETKSSSESASSPSVSP